MVFSGFCDLRGRIVVLEEVWCDLWDFGKKRLKCQLKIWYFDGRLV